MSSRPHQHPDQHHPLLVNSQAGPSSSQAQRHELTPSRSRFFPPPFRVDQTEQDDVSAGPSSRPASRAANTSETPLTLDKSETTSRPTGSNTGTSKGTASSTRVPPTNQPPKKKRRLLFTSELAAPPPTHNGDGTPSVAYLRYESTMRLKHKWDSIYERFKDAHLAIQDEIHLGKGKEKIRILRDNGILRALKADACAFGSFHIKEEDLVEVEEALRKARGGDEDDDDDDDDDFEMWDSGFTLEQYNDFGGSNSHVKVEPPEDDGLDRPPDPDLIAFLAEEARRRELIGDEDIQSDGDYEEDDGEGVIDFRDPQWRDSPGNSTTASSRQGSHSNAIDDSEGEAESSDNDDNDNDDDDDDDDDEIASTRYQSAPRRRKPAPAKVKSKGPDPFTQMMEEKRRNVEDALVHQQRLPPGEALMPYDDVPGLAELLGQITTKRNPSSVPDPRQNQTSTMTAEKASSSSSNRNRTGLILALATGDGRSRTASLSRSSPSSRTDSVRTPPTSPPLAPRHRPMTTIREQEIGSSNSRPCMADGFRSSHETGPGKDSLCS